MRKNARELRAIMKCPHCNQNHPEDTKFCPQIGKQIQQLLCCPNSKCKNYEKYNLPLDTHFCPDCGTPIQGVPSEDDDLIKASIDHVDIKEIRNRYKFNIIIDFRVQRMKGIHGICCVYLYDSSAFSVKGEDVSRIETMPIKCIDYEKRSFIPKSDNEVYNHFIISIPRFMIKNNPVIQCKILNNKTGELCVIAESKFYKVYCWRD